MPAGSAVVSVNAALGTSHKNVFRKKGYPRQNISMCKKWKNVGHFHVPLRFPAQAGDPMYLQLQLRHFNVTFVFEDSELRKSFEPGLQLQSPDCQRP